MPAIKWSLQELGASCQVQFESELEGALAGVRGVA